MGAHRISCCHVGRWNPDQLSDISEADLDEIFAPMPPGKGLRRDFLDD